TNSRDRLSRENLAYPAVLANLLPGLVRAKGIKPTDIMGTWWSDSEIIYHPAPGSTDITEQIKPKAEVMDYIHQEPKGTAAVLFLKDRRQIALRCEVRVF